MAATEEAQLQPKLPLSKRIMNKVYDVTSILESANFGTIFGFHLFKSLDVLFGSIVPGSIIFPTSAITGFIKTVIDWVRFKDLPKTNREYNKTLGLNIWGTISSTITLGAVTAGRVGAIIGVGVVASAAIGLGISIAFTIALGISSIIHGGLMCYHLYKGKTSTTNEDKKHHYLEALGHAQGFVILTLLTTGVVVAMLAGYFVIGGAIGVATCLLSVGLTIYNMADTEEAPAEEKLNIPTSTQGQLAINDPKFTPEQPSQIAGVGFGTDIAMPNQSGSAITLTDQRLQDLSHESGHKTAAGMGHSRT